MKITEQIIEERAAKAGGLFKQGYNCSQSVAGAWADIYNVDTEMVMKLATSFGAGIGRMRETCGAACGMFILAGLETGCTDPTNPSGKSNNYKVIQELAASFKEINGSINCGELLGLREIKEEKITHIPQERTPEYYKKRPCVEMVESAARIYGKFLAARQETQENQF